MFVLVRFTPHYGPVIQSVGNYNDNVFLTKREVELAKKWAREEVEELEISAKEAGPIKIYKLEPINLT